MNPSPVQERHLSASPHALLSRRGFLGVMGGGVWQAGGLAAAAASPQAVESHALPAPRRSGGRPLLEALNARQTTRVFSPRELSEITLAELLWAAFGVNRETGLRTAPSTMNLQVIDIYAVTATHAGRYDARRHVWERRAGRDVRLLTGGQDYVKVAPVALVYVADFRRMEKVPVKDRMFYAAADSGFIAQNVYLYCASEGLGSVVHMPGPAEGLRAALDLAAEQEPILAQSVGFPATPEA